MQWLRSLATFAALAIALLLWAEDADARLEGAPSVGKSAGGTFLTPQVAAPALAVIAANDHAAAGSSSYPGGSLGGLFNRPGVIGGFAAGFLGSGVLARSRAIIHAPAGTHKEPWPELNQLLAFRCFQKDQLRAPG